MKNTKPTSLAEKYYMPVMIAAAITAILVAVMPFIGAPGDADPKTAETAGLWVHFLGNFHPVFLHLPIGALSLVLLMEGLSVMSGRRYKPNTTLALAFAAGTAVLAVVFGYFLYLTGKYTGEDVNDHKIAGVVFTVLMIVTFMIKYAADVKKVKLMNAGYLASLGATALVMMFAGHIGGVISHGDPLKDLPSAILAERAAKNAPVADPVIYDNIVHVILENKCISCHGEDKEKGGLRLDSIASMLDGGDEEECLKKGDVKGSFMLASLDLPEDDDLHMPPKSKPQITPEEKKILTWWVEMGAPEKTKLSEVEVPKEIAAAIATLKTPEQRAAEEKALREQEAAAKRKFAETRQLIKKELHTINQKFPGALRYKSQEDTELTFSTVSYRKTFKEADLAMLKNIAEYVTDIDLSSTAFSTAGMEYLKPFKNLKNLKLNETKINDEAVSILAGLKSLQKLNLYGTQVTDSGIKGLFGHPKLDKVYLWNTKVTPAGAKQLRESLLKAAQATDKKRKPEVLLGISVSKK